MSNERLEQFEYFVLPNNITGGTVIVLNQLLQQIASITIHSI
ncbi:hypothetical protein [Niallia endozanthoxylica]|nr:hypothetical protein [Niallia endozanthoxylica]